MADERFGPGKNISFGGFSFKKASGASNTQKTFSMNAVPPPSFLTDTRSKGPSKPPAGTPGLSKQGYSTMDSIAQFANSSHYSIGSSKKKGLDEDSYFDDDESETPDLPYQPAPNSPGRLEPDKKNNESDESEDELDAFMSMINKQVQKEEKKVPIVDKVVVIESTKKKSVSSNKGTRADIDDEDDEESYYRYMEENPMAGVLDQGSDEEIEYDEDGNPIAPPRRRDIDPLPAIDHSEIEYQPFEKNFYTPHEDIANLDTEKVNDLRRTLGIKVTGPQPPHPVTSFAHFGFDETLMKAIRKSEFTKPTAIQAQAIPAALNGRDIIGIAKTGSGKTAAFLWPMLVHIMDQKELEPGDGPIGLILAPTRELSLQIYNEAKKFGKIYNIQVVCCYGGGSKWEQSKDLEKCPEIIVATPGRMIDMVKMKATNLRRVTYLVLDEADKMFNMGFEIQVRSICDHVRPDRQCLMFSATFKKKIEKLARDVLTDPIKIVQGDVGEANEDVTQNVLIFNDPQRKWSWLLNRLVEFLSDGTVLIFVTKKAECEQVANSLMVQEYNVVLLHGDMEQAERNKVITKFKKREADIMVATDVAARGLDIPHIRTVINYDIARDIDTHTHRIGRTGRAGEKGTAYTLVSDKDKEFVGHLVRNLEGANQEVPEDLMKLAMQSSWFRKSRFKTGKGKKINVGGAGLGFRARSTVSHDASSYEKKEQSGSIPYQKTSASPQMSRLQAMKEAFKSQYNSQFKVSSDRSWEKVQEGPTFAAPTSLPPPPPPPTSSSNKNPAENDGNNPSKKRRSRWD
uniref:ATP-dependent RNA helicase DDX42 n=1 Tax=Culicoides sonorensis TaxID=179676 RepID=A0A336KUY9_CULSO